ncbi:ArsR/SmtB family transcription factor [Qipengyuania psychrotolerans]|uniref:Metalloregulator ArsR/SmtB family transcription factor n=1 Tax=Qipengyuania psychrotolerans TaxID=2867238 RepID=A0ABX8ZC17_9SPHN|nr:metalloregulator ArsR/SmtB family transcription factor [Qipengyuania psychrotolerans]QZD86281.1 metalloregulator ArsR/SmtB family transcription factor [Qipengyuania psychrotolerans]
MTDTFVALSDPTRRLLLDRLSAQGGLTLSQLSDDLPMTRQAVAKHLAVLESAELVASERDGRCKRHYINPMPLAKMAKRWLVRFEDVPLGAMSGYHAPQASGQGGTAVPAASAHS